MELWLVLLVIAGLVFIVIGRLALRSSSVQTSGARQFGVAIIALVAAVAVVAVLMLYAAMEMFKFT